MNKTIYLGGTMPHEHTQKNEYLDAQTKLEEYFRLHGFKTFNPARGKNWKKTVLQLNKLSPGNDITYRDINDIRRCDVMLARMPYGPSIGTSMEIFYMGHVLYKPVIVVSDVDEIVEHPWIKAFSAKTFRDLDESLEYIVNEYGDG